MTLKERMTTIAKEEMLMREQHGRARARLQDILEVCDKYNPFEHEEADLISMFNEIADLARAGLKEK